jgi:hypothetical protein
MENLMMKFMKETKLKKWPLPIFGFFLAAILSACNNGGGNSNGTASTTPATLEGHWELQDVSQSDHPSFKQVITFKGGKFSMFVVGKLNSAVVVVPMFAGNYAEKEAGSSQYVLTPTLSCSKTPINELDGSFNLSTDKKSFNMNMSDVGTFTSTSLSDADLTNAFGKNWLGACAQASDTTFHAYPEIADDFLAIFNLSGMSESQIQIVAATSVIPADQNVGANAIKSIAGAEKSGGILNEQEEELVTQLSEKMQDLLRSL